MSKEAGEVLEFSFGNEGEAGYGEFREEWSVFRGTPGMYETDEKALSTAKSAINNGFDTELPAFQRWFLYVPFMHSEDRENQRRSVELFQKLGEEGETDLKTFAVGHKETIKRFGRFPHRNEILGRESTAQGVKFLKEQNRSRVEA
jgi:uncharacterized protein (DUF924 family)